MASGIFAILDDIAALMDDVAVTSKIATKQTAGILGDDLAVNAEKATGFLSSREIPVLLAIMKGSFLNKLIIVPLAFLLQFLYPPAISIILVIGGLYLAYEGMEKIVEFLIHRSKKGEEVIVEQEEKNSPSEQAKIKSAVTTDFILSVEIVIIAMGTVLQETFLIQLITVIIVAIIATVGVYGIVALIVRMDDLGYRLIKRGNGKGPLKNMGELLVKALPIIIKLLGIIGTIALLLVSGGIFDHNIPAVHHWLPQIPLTLKHMLLGAIAGLGLVLLISGGKKLLGIKSKGH